VGGVASIEAAGGHKEVAGNKLDELGKTGSVDAGREVAKVGSGGGTKVAVVVG